MIAGGGTKHFRPILEHMKFRALFQKHSVYSVVTRCLTMPTSPVLLHPRYSSLLVRIRAAPRVPSGSSSRPRSLSASLALPAENDRLSRALMGAVIRVEVLVCGGRGRIARWLTHGACILARPSVRIISDKVIQEMFFALRKRRLLTKASAHVAVTARLRMRFNLSFKSGFNQDIITSCLIKDILGHVDHINLSFVVKNGPIQNKSS